MFVDSSNWKWLLESFADRVANKEYKKTDYQIWRRLKNYNEVYIYYINGNDIAVEDVAKDLVENVEVFKNDDGSFGSYLAEHWLCEKNNMDFETGSTSAFTNYSYGYNYDLDSSTGIKNIVYDVATGEAIKTITSIAGDKINTASPSISIDFDRLAIKGVDDVCDTINELKAKIETKLDKAEYYNDNEKEKKSMNMFKGFEFGKVDGNKVRMSMYGLAVRNQAGTWVSYNASAGEVMDVDVFNMDGSQFMYKMPVALSQVKVSDVIIHNCKPMFVTGIGENGKFCVIDIYEGEEKMILASKSPFGFNFITKVVSLFNFDGMTQANAENPFGNMAMMMALSGDMKMDEILPLMLMTNGNMDMSNPMSMMLMMGMMDKDSKMDNSNLMMMMAMMNGAFNSTPQAKAE